jgi:alanyl-tRNA synthetase
MTAVGIERRPGPASTDRKLKTADVRASFLKYFQDQNHRVVPSDSLIPSTDPTLLFTSAGMVQFKPNFQNPAASPFKRAASCQKCLRTSDIERVGHTLRHLTFFEMLGNFSFGDYFKKESIAWGWEFLTKTIGLPGDRMVISVHKSDDEAFKIWEALVPKNKIYRLDDDTNFWTMGPTGPCGPCSEILWDRGQEWSCGKPTCGPACDCDRYLEIWNHVFTQFDRSADGKLTPLPSKNIDTGMGLERLTLLSQGVTNPFETDVFQAVIQGVAEASRQQPPKKMAGPRPINATEARFYRIADHARAVSFMINDGILPSNEGRGYVLRRLLRQAVRAGDGLGIKEPFLHRLTGTVIDLMQQAYPDLTQRRATIASVVKMEEEKFLETLETGTRKLDELVQSAKAKKITTLPGKEVFQLYDTFGFPFELTREMVEGLGMKVDEKGYKQAQDEAADLARSAWKGSGATDVAHYHELKNKVGTTTKFKGYDSMDLDSEVLAATEGEAVLKETPFYPEGGGQVGDKGWLEWSGGKADVLDTQTPVEGLIIHRIKVTQGSLKAGTKVRAKVDPLTREATMRHHTATHLLHKALREVLGAHVTQAGSLVAAEKLRFDFNHNAPLTPEQRQKVEDIVNSQILNDIPVRACPMTKDQAHKVGAMMLFGEKYGAEVRAVMVSQHDCTRAQDAWSLELCGGTHVHATGQVGLFKIVSQSAVSAGVRRIEAVAGRAALQAIRRMEQQLATLAESLKTTPDELPARVDRLLSKESELEKQLQQHKSGALREQFSEIAKQAASIDNLSVIVHALGDDVDPKQIREMADRLKENGSADLAILLTTKDDKTSFVVSAAKKAVERNINASLMAKEIAAQIQGSAGGRPDFAQGGGKIAFGIELVKQIIKKHTFKTPHKP